VKQHDLAVPRGVQAALDELQGVIAARYPDATFDLYRGEDPDAWWLVAWVDVEDRYDVIDLFLDRMVEMRVEAGLPVFVDVRRVSEREVETVDLDEKMPATVTA
jgi:hypothetical protein